MCCKFLDLILLLTSFASCALFTLCLTSFIVHVISVCMCHQQHGIGLGSFSIMMNEIIKALFHAQVSQNVVFFRVGTSGGVGRTRLSSSFILFLHIIRVSLLFNVTKSFLLSLIAILIA